MQIETPDALPGSVQFWQQDGAAANAQVTPQLFECRRLPWQAIDLCIGHSFIREPEDEAYSEYRLIEVQPIDGTGQVSDAWSIVKTHQKANRGTPGIIFSTEANLVFVFLLALHLLLDRLSGTEPPDAPQVFFSVNPSELRALSTLAVLLDSGSDELRKNRLRMSHLMSILEFYASQRFIGGHHQGVGVR